MLPPRYLHISLPVRTEQYFDGDPSLMKQFLLWLWRRIVINYMSGLRLQASYLPLVEDKYQVPRRLSGELVQDTSESRGTG